MENPPGNGVETPRRVAALETGLRSVVGRLDSLERSNRSIESDIRSMKDQITSMQSSIQEMLMIFRNLSEKVKQRAAGEGPGAAGQPSGTRRSRAQGPGSRAPADELVRDPHHMREDEDEDS
jgi:hypothetical protein